MTPVSFPVVWVDDEGGGAPTAGRLALEDGHAVFDGGGTGDSRHVEFDAADVESITLVPAAGPRLNGRPTLEIDLRERGRIRIAQLAGFGLAADLIGALTGV